MSDIRYYHSINTYLDIKKTLRTEFHLVPSITSEKIVINTLARTQTITWKIPTWHENTILTAI